MKITAYFDRIPTFFKFLDKLTTENVYVVFWDCSYSTSSNENDSFEEGEIELLAFTKLGIFNCIQEFKDKTEFDKLYNKVDSSDFIKVLDIDTVNSLIEGF